MGNVKTCKIRTNETYRIKIVVNGTSVKCYLNDALYIDYDTGEQREMFGEPQSSWDELTTEDGLLVYGSGFFRLKKI